MTNMLKRKRERERERERVISEQAGGKNWSLTLNLALSKCFETEYTLRVRIRNASCH